jgi:radical SAM superfamily enzyme YgiQ (UPF0313 family)
MRTGGEKSRIRVGLAQINNSFSNQNYLPLAVGMLQAYAESHLKSPDDYEFLLPIYRRLPVAEAVQHLQGVDIALFSTYVWNARISLEIAKSLKLQEPETIVVFGGPQVPDRVEGFLREHLYVDIACHGEGERSVTDILENCVSRDWTRISGISYLSSDGSLVQNPQGPRIDDLSEAPSPYIQETFAPLIEANPDEHWIALWETNRGCPFSCTFCDWGSAVQSKVHSFDVERLYQEVEWFARHNIEYVFCCDANFGILPRDLDIANHVAAVKSRTGYPSALSVQNTKNATERAYQTQKILSDAGLNKGVDIALQSMDKNTLESVKRANISLETYEELQRRFAREGVETYTDMIIGLPGETYDTFADGVSSVIENGQHNRIQFNNLSILTNSEMGDPEYQQKYGMVSVDSKIINVHGSVSASEDEIYESQLLVIATKSMPKEQWVKTRVFAWTAGLLHFDKILQIPLILLHQVCSISYRELLEGFSEGSFDSYPVLKEVHSFFVDMATAMQKGGPEYASSLDWLNIWWPADEYVFIKLCVENKLDDFYSEAQELLLNTLKERSLSIPKDILQEAISLNKSLIKLPFQTSDVYLDPSYNIWEVYKSALIGNSIPVESSNSSYQVDRTSKIWPTWDEWCQEVVWYGNKMGAYLYGNNAVSSQIAGHF